MKCKFVQPYLDASDLDMDIIGGILRSGWWSNATWVRDLESRFRQETKVKHAIACASCTSGLAITIRAAGWRNMRVGMPAFTWPSTLLAVDSNHNIAVFGDVDADTWYMEDAPPKIDRVLMVDTFGSQAPIPLGVAPENVIYDAAHSYGLPNLGKRGLAEVVSLGFNKPITAMEGGIILTDDDTLAEKATELRDFSSRMTEIGAYIASLSLDLYEQSSATRTNNARDYIRFLTSFNIQHIHTGIYSVFQILAHNEEERERIVKSLLEVGVETKRYHAPLADYLPISDSIYERAIALPIHSGATPLIEEICDIINEAADHDYGSSLYTRKYLLGS